MEQHQSGTVGSDDPSPDKDVCRKENNALVFLVFSIDVSFAQWWIALGSCDFRNFSPCDCWWGKPDTVSTKSWSSHKTLSPKTCFPDRIIGKGIQWIICQVYVDCFSQKRHFFVEEESHQLVGLQEQLLAPDKFPGSRTRGLGHGDHHSTRRSNRAVQTMSPSVVVDKTHHAKTAMYTPRSLTKHSKRNAHVTSHCSSNKFDKGDSALYSEDSMSSVVSGFRRLSLCRKRSLSSSNPLDNLASCWAIACDNELWKSLWSVWKAPWTCWWFCLMVSSISANLDVSCSSFFWCAASRCLIACSRVWSCWSWCCKCAAVGPSTASDALESDLPFLLAVGCHAAHASWYGSPVRKMLTCCGFLSCSGLDLGPATRPVGGISTLAGMLLMIRGWPLKDKTLFGGESFDCTSQALAPRGRRG